ncbi:MAG: 2-phosphoglycerate kinase [Oscillospiraceae bacterium]|nr:2-phosphoglycerate kinase [Oscillospiraceae bacterium]
MIILIGGAGCVGKTKLAQRLLERYKFPYLSLDHLKMGIIRSGADCGFTAESRDALISKKLWPIVRGIIMTAVENNQNLIIEGCYLPPDKIAALPEEYRKHIISFYLALGYHYAQEHYDDILAHRSDIENRLYPEERTANEIADENDQTISMCRLTGAKCFVIEKDYEAEMNAVVAWVDGEIKRRS